MKLKLSDLDVIILAGGLGTRLGDITKEIPKPMVMVNGKPFLLYQLEFLRSKGLNKFVICVSYLKDKIIEYFGDGSSFDFNIKYSIEEEPLGTGGAIKLAIDSLITSDPFFVVNGDTYIKYNPIIFLTTLLKNKADAIFGLKKDDSNDSSSIKIGERNKIISYVEKPENNIKQSYKGAGVYLFTKGIINSLDKGKQSLEYNIIPKLVERYKLYSELVEDFYDIGTKHSLELFGKYINIIE